MSDTEKSEAATELAAGDVTEFVSVFVQLDKGRVQLEATNALHEVVAAALATEKKGGTVSIKIKVDPMESGAVALTTTITANPVKDPRGTIFFTDGEGSLSRDNSAMFYGNK